MGQTYPIRTKTAFVPNLVKPPEAPNSRQPADSVAEINLKTWRVYPLESASLEIEIKFGASFLACAFSFATTLIPALTINAQSQGRFTPTHPSVAGELCPQGGPGTRPRHHSPRRSWRGGLRPQSHEPRLRGRQALRTNASLRLHGGRWQQALARPGKNQHLHARRPVSALRPAHHSPPYRRLQEIRTRFRGGLPDARKNLVHPANKPGRRTQKLSPSSPRIPRQEPLAQYLEAWHLLGKPNGPAEPMYRGHSQPRSGARTQPTAQAVGERGKQQAPAGRKISSSES